MLAAYMWRNLEATSANTLVSRLLLVLVAVKRLVSGPFGFQPIEKYISVE
jgi:hypothetical protein